MVGWLQKKISLYKLMQVQKHPCQFQRFAPCTGKMLKIYSFGHIEVLRTTIDEIHCCVAKILIFLSLNISFKVTFWDGVNIFVTGKLIIMESGLRSRKSQLAIG